MVYFSRATFAPLKTTTPASTGATYAAVGTALINPAVVLTFINNTNGDVIISANGVDDNIALSANSYRVFDIRTNAGNLQDFMFAKGTQFYAKDGTTPSTTGALFIEIIQVTET